MARPVRTNVFGGQGGNLDIVNQVADAGQNILDILGIDFGESSAPPVASTPVNNGHVPTSATSEPNTTNGTYTDDVVGNLGNDASYGARDLQSDVDLWNHINRWIWGKSGAESSPVGDWKAEPSAIKPVMHRMHDEQESRITAGKKHRDSIEAKVEDIYDTKAEKGHTHANGGEMDWYVKLAIIAVIGLIVYFLIRRALFK